MDPLKRYPAAVAMIVATFILAWALYDRLPPLMPGRWSIDGTIALWIPRIWAVLALPVSGALATAVAATVLSTRRYAPTVVTATAGLVLWATITYLQAAMDPQNLPPKGLFVGVGVFLIVIGNLLGKVSWNYFFGIRTPWTTDDPEVWDRTHRIAGPVLVIGGALLISAAMVQVSVLMLTALAIATILHPIAYSYWVWRRAESQRQI